MVIPLHILQLRENKYHPFHSCLVYNWKKQNQHKKENWFVSAEEKRKLKLETSKWSKIPEKLYAFVTIHFKNGKHINFNKDKLGL